jgi:hypothetical protein
MGAADRETADSIVIIMIPNQPADSRRHPLSGERKIGLRS